MRRFNLDPDLRFWDVHMSEHFVSVPVVLKAPVVQKCTDLKHKITVKMFLKMSKKHSSLSPELHRFVKPPFRHGCGHIFSLI